MFEMPPGKRPDFVTLSELRLNEIQHQNFTPAKNYGSAGGARFSNELFDDTPFTEVVWQGDVYHYVSSLLDEERFANVLDFGCGNAAKIAWIAASHPADYICIDFKNSLSAAKENFPTGRFVEANLGSWGIIDELADLAEQCSESTLIILSDVIEHLPDPRPVIIAIRNILSRNSKSRLVLSTPDRETLGYDKQSSPPRNLAHVREWTLKELCGLLACGGFAIERAGRVRENGYVDDKRTSLVKCRAADVPSCINSWGRNNSPNEIFITTEYPEFNAAGGIGTFVFNQQRRNPSGLVLAVVEGLYQRGVDPSGALGPYAVLAEEDCSWVPPEDVALLCLQQLLFLCPGIEAVHYQEYGGIGARIAQAWDAGLLPRSINTVVYCHGNVRYLEESNQEWMDIGRPLAELEKIAVEKSSTCVFATDFLKDLYRSSGVNPTGRTIVAPYWYELSALDTVRRARFDTVAFVGKRSKMKGFDLFLDALNLEGAKDALRRAGVKRILLIGRRMTELDDLRIRALRSSFEVEEHDRFNLSELKSYIRAQAGRAIFVTPYLADNSPIAVYDVISQGGFLLAADAGGVPEMLQSSSWSKCLFSPKPGSLLQAIIAATDLTSEDVDGTVSALQQGIKKNNELQPKLAPPAPRGNWGMTASIVVPMYNADPDFLEEAIASINNQTYPIEEVLFVDDGSSPEGAKEAISRIKQTCLQPYRVLSHEKNMGLPAARNSALHACRSELLFNLDADDIAAPDWVRNGVSAFISKDKVAAATPYLRGLEERSDGKFYPTTFYYRPIGEGFVLSIKDNILGHANAGFRVSRIRELGGWNDSSRAKWEDWELYRRIIGCGDEIAVIPSVDILYRVRATSMARTYGTWEGQQRIALVPGYLSQFESTQLFRQFVRLKSPPRLVDEVLVFLDRHPKLRRSVAMTMRRLFGVALATERLILRVPRSTRKR